MRWLVGDVQGCAKELDRLLGKIRFDPHRDELWCLGDLVNRGPDSLAALRLWRDVSGRGLIGNHDVYALLAFCGARKRKRDTLKRLFQASDGPELMDRLRAQPALFHLEATAPGVRDVWIVHAGLHPGWKDLARTAAAINAKPHDDAWLVSPEVSFATRVRCCTPDGEVSDDSGPPERCRAPYRPWDAYYAGPALVVHGHWATRGFYRNADTMGLDSGCVYGGRLTAWCQEEDRLVSVAARRGRG